MIAIFVFSFTILGWVGTEIFRQAPPIPREVVTTDGRVLIPAEQISERPECLAGNGRHAGRFDLGPRVLCRARLDGRLPAPRSAVYLK